MFAILERRTTPQPQPHEPDYADRELLNKIAAADRDSFDTLYRKYHKRIVNFAMRSTNRPDLAEEVASDTLFTVWQKAGSFSGKSKVSTWIFGIAYRKSLKSISRTARRESRTPAGIDDVPEPSVPPSQDAVLHRDHLAAALGALPIDQRTAMILAYVNGYKYEEIAVIVGKPVNTIKTRIRAARAKLHSLYGENPEPQG